MITFGRPDDESPRKRVFVVGDVMLHQWIKGEEVSITSESPTPVVRLKDTEARPGGAANVAANLVAWGLPVSLFGLVGLGSATDNLKKAVNLLSGTGSYKPVNFVSAAAGNFRTTVMTRIVAAGQQLVCVDDHDDVNQDVAGRLPMMLSDQGPCCLLVVYDRGLGAVSRQNFEKLVEWAAFWKVPVFLDTKRRGDFDLWKHADVVKTNRATHDAAVAAVLGKEPYCLDTDARHLVDKLGLKELFVTKGDAGLFYFSKSLGNYSITQPGVQLFPASKVGVGDVVTGVLAGAMAGDVPLHHAAYYAPIAASLSMKKGTTCVAEPYEMWRHLGEVSTTHKYLSSVPDMARWSRYCARANKRIVFTSGSFDLFHVGHLHFLKAAADMGDALVVSLNEDNLVAELEGPGRPFVEMLHRVSQVATQPFVAAVTCHDNEARLLETIKALKPDVLVKGEEWRGRTIVGADFVAAKGGRVEFVKRLEGPEASTAGLVEKARASKLS